MMRKDGTLLKRGVFDLEVSFDGMFHGITGTRNLPEVSGEKEAAGVCRGRGESMEIQSKLACNQIFSTKRRLPMKHALQAHTLQLWHNRASAAPAASFWPTNRKLHYSRSQNWLEKATAHVVE
ncbi:MAG: hypothetical protein ABSG62_18410 [Terracidiphilus sp.]